MVARHHHPAFDRDCAAFDHRQDLAAGGSAALSDEIGVGLEIDQLEFEPRGLADQCLQSFGILDPRNLDQDAPLALVYNGDFLGALRIDAAADDIARNGHCILERAGVAVFGRNQFNTVGVHHADVPVAASAQPDGLAQGAHPLDCGVDLR